eukprot:7394880-Pyramimonas_sp.AAC.1
MSPTFWRSVPFAVHLASADGDNVNEKQPSRPAAAARQELLALEAASEGARVRVQKTLSAALRASLFPDLLP